MGIVRRTTTMFKWSKTLVLALLILLPSSVISVDRSKFRTCAQTAFCNRARSMPKDQSQYRLDMTTLVASYTGVHVVIINAANDVRFKMEILAVEDGTFRVRIREAFPLVPRFEVPYVVANEPVPAAVEVLEQSASGFVIRSTKESHKVAVRAEPLRLDFYSNDQLVMSANANGLLRFEHTRPKKHEDGDQPAEEQNVEAADETDEPGAWEESFGGHTDSKPNGPQAVAMDFSFLGMDHVYGVPEHADSLSLKDSSNGDPYRLYNLDVFEYELWNKMSLYAAIPFVMAHSKSRSVGLFWLNAAETWIDVKKSNSGVLGSISTYVSSSPVSVNTHWISESGIIEFFVFLGPKPRDVSRQYARITGATPLPPEFSLGYHQCRWNYNDQEDVRMVTDKFDEYDIPMDVMWLDIEHTDAKKYFTWDGRKFGNSLEMVQNLTALGRKLVTIVDPHIKKDSDYWVHNDLTEKGLYVKNKEGKDYEGWCWPGASYYPDFLNPQARDYFSNQYLLDNYKGTTLDVYTWNDMNEPSVFNGPEVTMPKDMVHYGGFEHRDLHNMYGHLYIMGTHQGHLMRADNKLRPFILTRSAFAGSQRYAAIWTGDNKADWGHLEASVPMCLSLALSGMTFCGADVGGFFGNPDGDLFLRWYQAAAFQPFFRSHAHIDTRRREPWLYSDSEMKLIRDAVRLRYSYLPLWYTLFYEGELTGVPAMRPIWYEFTEDEAAFGIDYEHLVGDALLVRPVTKAGATDAVVYFPGTNQVWYDIFTYARTEQRGEVTVPLVWERIPVYQRGGSIVAKKERVRRSSPLMHNDPYTLVVAMDRAGNAQGTLYIDDEKSFDYRQGKSIYIQFNLENGKLSAKMLHPPGYATKTWLERVVIMGWPKEVGSATVKTASGDKYTVTTAYDREKQVLTVRKPDVGMADEWEITLA